MRVIDTPFGYYLTWLYMAEKKTDVSGQIEDETQNQQIYGQLNFLGYPHFFQLSLWSSEALSQTNKAKSRRDEKRVTCARWWKRAKTAAARSSTLIALSACLVDVLHHACRGLRRRFKSLFDS